MPFKVNTHHRSFCAGCNKRA